MGLGGLRVVLIIGCYPSSSKHRIVGEQPSAGRLPTSLNRKVKRQRPRRVFGAPYKAIRVAIDDANSIRTAQPGREGALARWKSHRSTHLDIYKEYKKKNKQKNNKKQDKNKQKQHQNEEEKEEEQQTNSFHSKTLQKTNNHLQAQHEGLPTWSPGGSSHVSSPRAKSMFPHSCS